MTVGETPLAAMAFQLSLYAGIRLAHRGFTLGELGLVCFGGVAVLFETMALTTAHVSRCLLQPYG
jgi:dolichol kinase